MAYNPLIPQPTNKIKISQAQLLENFTQILNVFQANHSPFNGGTPGRHINAVFVNQTANVPPIPIDTPTLADEFALYAKTSALTGFIELFTRRSNNGTIFGITEANLIANGGYARTSSGLLLQWGTDVANATIAPFNPVTKQITTAYPNAFIGIWFTVKTVAGDPNTQLQLINIVNDNQTYQVFAGQRTAVNVDANVSYNWLSIGF